MDGSKINWKETFFFFYWDLRHYRIDDADRVNQLVLDFLFHKAPSPIVDSPPESWDALLRHLMRSLRHHLGSQVIPSSENEFEWLAPEVPKTTAPYVDWISIRPYYAEPWSKEPLPQSVQAIIDHLQIVAYGPFEQRAARELTMELAWRSNPFLVDYANAHLVRPWETTWPFNTDFIDDPNLLQDCFNNINKTYLAGDISARHRIRFNIRIDTLGHRATLDFQPREALLCVRALNLAKRLYTAMLRFVEDMQNMGEVTPFLETLRDCYEDWKKTSDGETMKTNMDLWQAIRAVGLSSVPAKPSPELVEQVAGVDASTKLKEREQISKAKSLFAQNPLTTADPQTGIPTKQRVPAMTLNPNVHNPTPSKKAASKIPEDELFMSGAKMTPTKPPFKVSLQKPTGASTKPSKESSPKFLARACKAAPARSVAVKPAASIKRSSSQTPEKATKPAKKPKFETSFSEPDATSMSSSVKAEENETELMNETSGSEWDAYSEPSSSSFSDDSDSD